MILGASLTPTRYKVRILKDEYHVRCGADLLLNGMTLDVAAEGRCPVCDGFIRFQVKDGRVLELEPDTAILHVVELPMMVNGRHAIECEGSPLFDRQNCLQTWLNDYRGRPGSIHKPQEFLDRMIRAKPSKGSN